MKILKQSSRGHTYKKGVGQETLVTCTTTPMTFVPALLTNMSTLPNTFTALSTDALVASGSERSTGRTLDEWRCKNCDQGTKGKLAHDSSHTDLHFRFMSWGPLAVEVDAF